MAHPCEREPLTLTVGDGVTIQFCWIPAGSFLMGSPNAEDGHEELEAPQHRVVISAGFRMTCTPITRDQWAVVMELPRPPQPEALHPVTGVSWTDANRFTAKLSAMLARGAVRLPTEAEWEYACRAGSTGRYAGGDTESDLARMGWYAGNSGDATHSVGDKAPNDWGLYDMHGHVFEWCQDWYGAYASGEQSDPAGPSSGEKRILRGGCFKCPPPYCRSANRYSAPPDRKSDNFGFRVSLLQKGFT